MEGTATEIFFVVTSAVAVYMGSFDRQPFIFVYELAHRVLHEDDVFAGLADWESLLYTRNQIPRESPISLVIYVIQRIIIIGSSYTMILFGD